MAFEVPTLSRYLSMVELMKKNQNEGYTTLPYSCRYVLIGEKKK